VTAEDCQDTFAGIVNPENEPLKQQAAHGQWLSTGRMAT